ncbi:MAG: right-handed parallel beta-helix repeat-containing protein [Planctomycetota bacterium]
MKKILLLSIVIFFSISILCFSNTIHVPGDQPTIQAGIDAAVNGDTVLVAPGIYVENIDFLGKAITVKSSDGAESTIIDGGNPLDPDLGSVITFSNSEGADSVLDGFALTNGTGTYFEYVSGWWDYCGGGIFCNDSSPTLTNNTISGNMAEWQGGGVYCISSSPTVINSVISGNSAGEGGGICCNISCSPTFTNNTISENSAHTGGGIFCYLYSTLTLLNNTISENTGENAGGIFSLASNTLIIANTILWNNEWPEIWLENGHQPSTFTISYSDIKGGKPSVIFEGTNWTLNWGPGIIDSNPLFADSDNDDFHLTFQSPCRGSGDNTAPGLPDFDFEGDPRIYQGTVDIGADEFYTHFYCTGDFTPGGSIEGKLVGLPGTAPTGIFFGSGVLNPPFHHKWGDFNLEAPWFVVPLGSAIPADGILKLSDTIPASPVAPYDVYMQALIGLDSDSLTNLFVLEVR